MRRRLADFIHHLMTRGDGRRVGDAGREGGGGSAPRFDHLTGGGTWPLEPSRLAVTIEAPVNCGGVDCTGLHSFGPFPFALFAADLEATKVLATVSADHARRCVYAELDLDPGPGPDIGWDGGGE